MKKTVLLMVLLSGFLSMMMGQTPDQEGAVPTDRVLNSAELREARWYYSIEEAMANPEEVYKLSLSEQSLKELPLEVCQFKNLQMLNLSSCDLKSLPDSIRILTKLQFLSLYDNKLKQLPDGFRELKNLEVLYLGKNKLIDIPIWVGGMGKLRRLDISRNRITPLQLSQIRTMMPKVDLTY